MDVAEPPSTCEDDAQVTVAAPAMSRRRTATLNRILAAARQTFYEKGFHDTSIAEIAKRSGVSRTTLYSHYTRKDEMLLDLLHSDLSRQMQEYEKLAAIRQLSRKALKTWLMGFRAVMDARRGSIDLFHVSFNLLPEVAVSVARHREAAVAKLGRRFKGFNLAALKAEERELARARCYMMIFLIEEVTIYFSPGGATPSFDVGRDLLACTMEDFLKTGRFQV